MGVRAYLGRWPFPLEPFFKKKNAWTRSSGCVTLRLRGSPGTTRTAPPADSQAQASSVQRASPWGRRAKIRASGFWRKTCGVWTVQRVCLSRVAMTLPPRTRFTVSETGRAGIAAPARSAALKTRRMRSAATRGRAASWIATQGATSGPDTERAASPRATDAERIPPPSNAATAMEKRARRNCRRTRARSRRCVTTTMRLVSGIAAKAARECR